jgi:hypothetical protein
VCLLEEEMRRVLAYLRWHVGSWIRSSESMENVDTVNPEDPTFLDGQKAYALRQAHVMSSLHQHFLFLWREVPSWIREGKIPNQDEDDMDDDE